MLPNRVAAALITALLLLVLVPGPSTAQSGNDLIVQKIEAPNLVVGVPSSVSIIIKNEGSQNFNAPATGWRLFIGFNGPNEANCIEPGGVASTSDVCYQDMSSVSIAARSTYTHTFLWSPTSAQKSDLDLSTPSDRLHVEILSRLGMPNGQDPSPPDSNPLNNQHSDPVFVKAPSVRAVPDRELPPDGGVNDAWTLDDIKDSACDDPAKIYRVGCLTKPGTLVSFSYRLKNEGNADDVYVPSVRDTTSPRSLAQRGYKFFFSPSTIALAANQTGAVTVQILMPENETAFAGVNINQATAWIRWTSSLNNQVTTALPCGGDPDRTQAGLCADPSLPTLGAKVRRSVWVGNNESWVLVDAGIPAQLNLSINNTGNDDDFFRVFWDRSKSTINDSWAPTANQPGGIFISSFDVENSSFSITPPLNATRGIYKLDLYAESQLDANKVRANQSFTLELRPRYAIAGGAVNGIARVVPDEEAVFNLFVNNLGNAPDNATLKLENVPSGWESSISARAFTLDPFGRQLLTLKVRPPENTINNTYAEIFVNVTSQGKPEQPEALKPNVSIKVNVSVLRGPNTRVTAPLWESFIDPGKNVTFEMTVRNTGNVEDNFTLSTDREDISWTAQLDPPYLRLRPLEQATARVTVRVPATAEVGEEKKVFVTIQSTVDIAKRRVVNFTGRISGPDLFVASVAAEATSIYAGQDVGITVILGNEGNKPPTANATLRLEYLKDGVPTLIGAQRLYTPTELPGGIRKTERFVWNTTGVEGNVLLRASIDPEDIILEIDDSDSSNVATRAATVRTFEMRFTAAQGLSGRPGEEISYGDEPNVFIVEYRGNQDTEPIEVVIESEHGWVLDTESGASRKALDLVLRPFAPVGLPVQLRIPERPGVAADTLRVVITPKLRPESVIYGSTTTTVIDEEAPEILAVLATPDNAKLGQDVTINAQVRDATGLRSVTAYVVRPGAGNVTETLPMTHIGDGVYSVTRVFEAAGEHRYYVGAVDGSSAGNANDTQDTLRTFRITPGSAPVIKLAANQSMKIRTGSPIGLNITDPLGIAKVNYTISGVDYELTRPFDVIDTSSFAAGTIQLVITAENIYGARTSAPFSFVVDNTPPQIQSVEITPTQPAINEEVTVRIRTDGDAASVEVAVSRDGQLVATHKAARIQGAWEVKYNPGEGENVLDVTAKDEAGNPTVKARAVVFTAKPKGFLGIPGFEVAVLALAAVAVALAMRRR